jgi:hypothetical protein
VPEYADQRNEDDTVRILAPVPSGKSRSKRCYHHAGGQRSKGSHGIRRPDVGSVDRTRDARSTVQCGPALSNGVR